MTPYLDLNPELTPTQEAIKQETHRFAAEVMRPASIALDKLADPQDVIREDSVYWDVLRKFYELEYHAARIPAEVGGGGLKGLDVQLINEEFGWGSADFAIGFGATMMPFGIAILASMMSGDSAMMDEFVTPFIQDREAKFIGCWAVTEPQHGSDSLAINLPQASDPLTAFDTRAQRDGDDWILSGAKAAWVSNGTVATHAMVHFSIDRSRGVQSSGIAIVPLDLPGISRGKPLNKLGQRALNQGEIYFDSVRLPKQYVVIEQELYTLVSDSILSGANSTVAATITGLARAALEEALNYTKQRVQGGKPLCEHQLVQRKLFDMYIKVEAARQLSRAVAVYNSAVPPSLSRLSIAAKVFCTQTAFEVANDAVQLFGGYGLSKDFLIEKLFRDARASLIEDGANDVLALVAARQLIDQHLI